MRTAIEVAAVTVLGLLATVSVTRAQSPGGPAATTPPVARSPTAGYPVPRRIDPLRSKDELLLYPHGAPKMPGAASEESWDAMGDNPVVRNVVAPTLRPYLPAADKANGAAVVVAPGGGFMMLAMKEEGWDVAQWLADHGITAFVLKYRVNPTPVAEAEFDRVARERMAAAFRPAPQPAPVPTFQPAVDDGVEALKLIRAHAADWHVDPKRLGMIGFSAGAMTTLSVALAQRDGAHPAFVGLIYGPMTAVQVPADAPPLFAALAADDPLFGRAGTGLLDSWRQAGHGAELHVYQQGGHGFGLGRPLQTTQLWPEEFERWLGMNGFLGATP